jgi:hydroxymethylglutaryl-CoA synthase
MTDAPVVGIRAVGAYAPRLRIESDELADALGSVSLPGIDTTAVPDADEDALTMAIAAGRRAIGALDRETVEPEALAFATTTPPLDEEELTARLGSALGVDSDVYRQQFLGSTRAGTRALWALADGDRFPALVIASDCPEAAPDDEREHVAGAGATAVLLEPPAACPARIVARAEHASPYPGTRFRERGSDRVEGLSITSYDRTAFTETISGAVDELRARLDGDSVAALAPEAVAIQAPDGALPYRAGSALEIDAEQIKRCAHVQDLGDTGAASVLLSLASALADGADTVLCASFGSGAGSDALLIERDEPVPSLLDLGGGGAVQSRTLPYSAYLRRRGELTTGPPGGGGAYVSVPTWRRSSPQRHRLVAGRCPDCAALAYPPRGTCRDCGSRQEYEPLELPGTGTIETVTTISQGGAPPEFAEQQAMAGDFAVAIVAFDGPEGDATVSVPLQVTDIDPETIGIGDRVTTTVRRIYTQEGVTRWGCKVRPV